ncbi:hypothetical protein PG993_000086 [Apiospora rasikravindrae]|uniref:F-box domain-containing protein n=1 Tax=Apiospora rasikravindrae TaxID=990691 RepID=A0ABR1UAA1_9PEZI
MEPFRRPGIMRRGQRGPWGLALDGDLYSHAPNAFTHRAALYEARIYAAGARSSFEITNHALPLTSTATNIDGGDARIRAGLGDLDYLPTELVMIVLEHCTLRTLLRLLRVNRMAITMVRCLRDFDAVANTIQGNKARARGPYPKIWATLMRLNTFHGMRQLMLCKTCDKCGDEGAKLRVAKVKILCDKCHSPASLKHLF